MNNTLKSSRWKISNTPAGWFCWGVAVGAIVSGLTDYVFESQTIYEAGIGGLMWLAGSFAILYGCFTYIRVYGE